MNWLKRIAYRIAAKVGLPFTDGNYVRMLESDDFDVELDIHESATINTHAESTTPDFKGRSYDVTIFTFGKSLRHPHYVYTREAAERSIPVFDGAKVYANSIADDFGHKTRAGEKVPKDIIASVIKPYTTETEFRGTMVILPSADAYNKNISFSLANKLPMPYELSIDAGGNKKAGIYQGERLPIIESFSYAQIDIVDRGAAGGRINRLKESNNNSHNSNKGANMKNKLALLFTLLYPNFLESKGVDLVKIDENELYTHLLEADKAQSRLHLPEGSKLDESVLDKKISEFREALLTNSESVKNEVVMKQLQIIESMNVVKPDAKLQESINAAEKRLQEIELSNYRFGLKTKLAGTNFPNAIKESLEKRLGVTVMKESEIDNAIADERKVWASIVQDNPQIVSIKAGMDSRDKIQAAMDGFFLTSSQSLKPVVLGTDEAKVLNGVTPFRSMREAYVQITGDVNITGQPSRSQRFTEAVDTTQFAQVVADALNKRLVRDYQMMNLDGWRNIADVVPLSDFKTQHRVRFGGYANLPTVAQSAPYVALTSPADEEVTYAATKKGGLETITREAIMNDDIGAIQRIPTRMARAAAQTLHEFVFDLIKPSVNATYEPDSTALYHADHANTATTALDATALAAARLRLKKQTQAGSSKRLGLRAKWLIVPSDLEKTAYELTFPAAGNSNAVPTFLQQTGVLPMVVDYWTDATDWVLAADKSDITCLEVGFVGGQETPEIFVSDLPNAGSFFTNDITTFKIRHEYGGDILDFRGLDGSIVA